MIAEFNAEALTKEMVAMLLQHGMRPQALAIYLELQDREFDQIRMRYPGHPPGIVLLTLELVGVQTAIQIMRERSHG